MPLPTMPAPDSRRRWRRRQRLSGDAVDQVLAGGRTRSAGSLKLQYCPNGLSFARLAQVIPKRLAPRAVDRNRVRRAVREVFRIEQARWTGYDCVVRLRVQFVGADDYQALARRLIACGP